jgi:hypothetical protein
MKYQSKTSPYSSRSGTQSSSWGLLRSTLRLLVKLRVLWIILVAVLFLSGCVRYEVGMNFADANHGEWVQRIRLEKQTTSLGETIATAWFNSLEQKAETLGGQVRHPSERELLIQIPFFNASDLETKFNQFFQSENRQLEQSGGYWKKRDAKLPELESRLHIKTNNFVFRERHYLELNLDLRSLETLTNEAGISLDPEQLLDLEFRLTTPWGAQIISSEGMSEAIARQQGKQLVWTLKPGEVNHLEAVFAVPNPLGTGFVGIAIFVLLGMFVKFLMLPPTAVLPFPETPDLTPE